MLGRLWISEILRMLQASSCVTIDQWLARELVSMDGVMLMLVLILMCADAAMSFLFLFPLAVCLFSCLDGCFFLTCLWFL